MIKPFANTIRHAVRAAIKRLNLVTRDEFEVQSQVLVKTKLRVQQLEKELQELLETSSAINGSTRNEA